MDAPLVCAGTYQTGHPSGGTPFQLLMETGIELIKEENGR
jgi:hypothetical protein